MGDRVMDEDAFYSSSENEHVSESGTDSDIQDSTVSTVVLEQGEDSGKEGPVADLPVSVETAINTSESYHLGTSHDAYRGLDDADDAMEESNEESGIETIDNMSSDDGN